MDFLLLARGGELIDEGEKIGRLMGFGVDGSQALLLRLCGAGSQSSPDVSGDLVRQGSAASPLADDLENQCYFEIFACALRLFAPRLRHLGSYFGPQPVTAFFHLPEAPI